MHHESHILHRQLRGNYPVAVSAEGCWITDSAGKKYLDASGGAAVSCLGHGHPDVLAAMHAQIDRIAYAHTSFFSTEVAEQLADTLIASAPGGTSHAYLVSGGSEAMEAALKLARQYFVEKGRAAARAIHRTPQQLSRQHAWSACSRWQSMAPPAVRAAADRCRTRLTDVFVS